LGVASTVLVAFGSSVWFIGSNITKVQANQKTLQELMEANQTTTESMLQELVANQKTLQALMEANQKELLAAMSCLPRAFCSVATGLREAAAGSPVHALVAASPADCVAWLTEAGFAQYAPMLAPLGGATLLLQTPASLTLAGVAPQHVAPLLEKIIAAAGSPPTTDVRDAR
jgi:hypothetical protein